MLFINPPFGNYFGKFNYFKQHEHISVIHGSFTKNYRPGLIIQIFKTLRYSFKHKGWVNCIGLRNPGIHFAIENKLGQQNDIISIAIKNKDDIDYFYNHIPENTNIEINISCPNSTVLNSNHMSKLLNNKRNWCIVKLSPIEKKDTIDKLYNIGFRQFHCCNTLPLYRNVNDKQTFRGGLSGISLIPFVCDKIHYIKTYYKDTIVIAGGGIQSIDTLQTYYNYGADHFAISTLCFSPFSLVRFYFDYMKWCNKY